MGPRNFHRQPLVTDSGLRAGDFLRKTRKKDDAGRIAHRNVLPSEVESAASAIDPEGGDVVSALVAAIEELTGGIEVEAAGIVATGPFFGDEVELTVFGDGECSNAVVETVARVKETAVGTDQDFGGEAAARKARREARNGFTRGQATGCGIVIKKGDG